MSDKAKVYPLQGDGPFRVWLSWKGNRYSRGHYDSYFKLIRRDMAERIAGAINQDIDEKGQHFDPRDWFASEKDLQFSHAVDQWYRNKTYAPGTVKFVERSLFLAKEHFKDQNIKSIRKAHVKMFLETLSQAPTTKRTILSFVKSALNEICDDWHLMRIPFPSVSIPYREQRWIRREDQDAIIDELLERDRPIFRLLRAYGCRISEACALMWDCVDLNHKRIVFRRTFSGERYLRDTTKTGYHRHNPMSDAIVDMLRPLRLDISSQFVFKNCHGNHYRARSLNDLWKRACRRAQHEYINIENAFRHSKNMQLKAAGFDLKSRSDFLGHRNVRTTEIYEEVDFEAQRGMVG